jgi:hypothetical protein
VQGYAAVGSAANGQGGTVTVSGSSGTVTGGIDVPVSGPTFTQLLLRDATDGTRVRLYEQQFTTPKFSCPPGATCAEPAMPVNCLPGGFVVSEVSNLQVAGQIEGTLWQTTPAETVQVVGLGIVGNGQPQPILAVIVHTGSPVASVVLKTPYGTDTEAPTGQWAGLAVGLPSDFSKSGGDGITSSTLTATDASGKVLVPQGLAQSPAIVPPCVPCPAIAQATQGQNIPASKAPASKAPATGAVAPVPTPLPCAYPCGPAASNTRGAVPNIAMCVRPPLGSPWTPGAVGGGGGSAGGSSGSASGSASTGSAVSGSASSGPATVVNP